MKRILSFVLLLLMLAFTACSADKQNEIPDITETTAQWIAESAIYPYDTSPLTAMSFNILYKMDDETRISRVIRMIENYSPDTLGVQEAPIAWIRRLDKNLDSDYARVGKGRDGSNAGEFNAIYYKESVFELIEGGTKWLSDTPDEVSKYRESSLNRIFTYAHLRRKSDGTELMIVNTHLDHASEEARMKQTEVLAAFLEEYNDMPLILSGDFNANADSASIRTVESADVVNSETIAETTESASTFTSFGTADSVIDFIFVTEDQVDVSSYRVCSEKIDGDYPSDHHPVLIEYTIE